MSIDNSNKKRRYYKNYGSMSKSTNLKTYLLRYEKEPGKYLQEGPFSSEELAIEKLNSFLKAGICSWLVSYNVP